MKMQFRCIFNGVVLKSGHEASSQFNFFGNKIRHSLAQSVCRFCACSERIDFVMKISKTLRYWILGGVFFALLGLQVIESTHHHETSAIEAACPVCQVVAHTPLDVAPPAAALISEVLLFLFYLPGQQKTTLIVSAYYESYRSRAPPRFTA